MGRIHRKSALFYDVGRYACTNSVFKVTQVVVAEMKEMETEHYMIVPFDSSLEYFDEHGTLRSLQGHLR